MFREQKGISMARIKDRFINFKDRLIRINDKEPLSRLSLIVIIIVDLFILSVIFQGLDEHTGQLTSPDEYFPHQCREVFIQKDWMDAVFLARLQELVLSDYNNTSYRYDGELQGAETEIMHPSCRALFERLNKVSTDQNLNRLFVDRQTLVKEKEQVTLELNKSKNVYDTFLLENIATNGRESSNLPALKDTIDSHSKRIEAVTRQLVEIDEQINGHDLIIALRTMIEEDRQYRERLIDDYKKYQFTYPLKELAWQLLFMLPLFVVFYIWSSRSVRNNNRIQALISTHLLVISFIPIIFKTVEVVLDLIPNHFFKDLFKLLKALHIIALWHYIVIIVAIATGLSAVYFIQKKIFNIQRIQQKRLANKECYACGKKLPNTDTICPFCGVSQFTRCDKCQQETYVAGEYCRHCGHKQTNL